MVEVHPTQVHRRITVSYDNEPSESFVRRLMRVFDTGKEIAFDRKRFGHSSLITEHLEKRICNFIANDRRIKGARLSSFLQD